MHRNAAATRTRLLDAASWIVVEQGVDALTLEAVAHRAGVSKGGLLHHFASKEALTSALVEHAFATYETVIEQALDPAESEGTPGRWTRAYVRSSFDTDERVHTLVVALALMTRRTPDLVRAAAAGIGRIWEALDHDGLDAVSAALIRSAADGVYYNEAVGNPPLPEPMRSEVREMLLAMTREAACVAHGERGGTA